MHRIEYAHRYNPQNKAQLQSELHKHKGEAEKQLIILSECEKSCPIDDKKADDPWITIATDLQLTQHVTRLVNQSAFYKDKVRIRLISLY